MFGVREMCIDACTRTHPVTESRQLREKTEPISDGQRANRRPMAAFLSHVIRIFVYVYVCVFQYVCVCTMDHMYMFVYASVNVVIHK